MGRSVWLASAAMAMVTFCNVCYSQTATAPTSIARFDDIAGKWTGHANNHNVSLEIDTTGRFTARYALGGESGEARLAGGTLVVPLAEHDGTLELVWDGDTLKGSGLLGGKAWMVILARSGQSTNWD
jgi:hypothetical protein